MTDPRPQRWYERILFERPHSYYSGSTNGDARLSTVFGVIGLALCVLGAVLAFGIRGLDHHYSKQACGRWAELTGREAQWMDLSFWQYDCYVNVDGRWMPKDYVIDLEGRRLNINLEGEG